MLSAIYDREGKVLSGYLNIGFTIFVVSCVLTLLLLAVSRWLAPRSPGARNETPGVQSE